MIWYGDADMLDAAQIAVICRRFHGMTFFFFELVDEAQEHLFAVNDLGKTGLLDARG